MQPLVAAGRVTGLLLTADTEPGAPDPTVTAAMELLAMHTAAMLAVATSVEELSRQATRDPLTGLRNRRGLLELLQRSAAEGGWALVLLDLDGFKAVNDLRGHARGDAVLSGVAESLTAAAPDGSLVFRLGGDEFALLAPGLAGGRDAADLGAELVRAAAQTSRAGEPGGSGPAPACACSTRRRRTARSPTRTTPCTSPSAAVAGGRSSGRRSSPCPEPGRRTSHRQSRSPERSPRAPGGETPADAAISPSARAEVPLHRVTTPAGPAWTSGAPRQG